MKKLFFILVTMLLPMVASADAVEIDGIYYNIITKGNVAEVTSHPSAGYSGNISIPSSVVYGDVTYTVTAIGYQAFYGCSGLTSITIPSSVTSIDSFAFYQCTGLTSITIPNSVTSIGSFAFAYCTGLTSITIPNSVTSIGSSAFSYCSGLTSITIPNSVTNIGGSAFYYCIGLTSITIPNSVKSIGSRAFYGCYSLTSVTIPNSVTRIESATFSNCTNMTSVIISENVTNIESEAFISCRLENVMAKNSKVTFSSNYTLSSFSDRTYQHAMLYIPEGTWNEAVYDGDWYRFNNIREVAMGKDGVSSSRAYTLMDTQTFGYAVYDPDDQEVKIAKAFYSFDEKDQNCCWKIVNEGGNQYIYNLGAKKYAQFDANGKITLTSAKVPVAMNEGDNGVKLGNDTTREWGFVKNNAASSEETYTPGDVNSDNLVNVTDIVATVNYIMEKPSEGFNKAAADLNGDGYVNVTDIVKMVSIIMAGD